MTRTRQRLFAVIVILSIAGVAAAADVEVNACGQTYSGNGYLSADLDCSASVDGAITIETGSLDLRGFTVTGPPDRHTIDCKQRCRITSSPPGGTITGGFIPIQGGRNLRMSDVIVTDSFRWIEAGKVRFERVTVNNVDKGVQTFRAVISDSSFTGGSSQISTIDLKLENSSITGTLDPDSPAVTVFHAARVSASTVSNNAGGGIRLVTGGNYTKANIVDSFVENNGGTGIFVDAGISAIAKVVGTSVINNGLHGVRANVVQVVDSTVTGNGTDADCGTVQTCADIAARDSVLVDAESTCETSYRLESGFPGTNWGVCSLD